MAIQLVIPARDLRPGDRLLALKDQPHFTVRSLREVEGYAVIDVIGPTEYSCFMDDLVEVERTAQLVDLQSFEFEGRSYRAGEFVRVWGWSRELKFKIRKAVFNGEITWVETYGPYTNDGVRRQDAAYWSIDFEDILAKARER